MGGKVATFYGLSGAGDLIATSYSRHSRNRRVGEQLGSGELLRKITSSMQMVAEGIPAIPLEHFMDIEHIFSHIRWNLQVYRCKEDQMENVESVGLLEL